MANQEVTKRQQDQPAQNVERTDDAPTFIPDVDIWEDEAAIHLVADMPGIDENNVDIDLDRDVLTIQGSYKLEAPEGFSLAYQEYRSGHYERSFRLGNDIDRDNIEANVNNGVLRLELPKSKEAQPRKIEVSTG